MPDEATIRLLQQAIGHVTVDGVAGPQTTLACRRIDEGPLLDSLRRQTDDEAVRESVMALYRSLSG